jgi:hypothetical protein
MRLTLGAGSTKSRPTQALRIGAGAALLFHALIFGWLLLKPGSHSLFTAVDNIAQCAGSLLLVPLCFIGARSALKHGGRQLVPLLLGAGVVAFAAGQILWTYYEQVLHQATPFPSLADLGFLAQYPFLTVGVLLMSGRRLSAASRARLLLDECWPRSPISRRRNDVRSDPCISAVQCLLSHAPMRNAPTL